MKIEKSFRIRLKIKAAKKQFLEGEEDGVIVVQDIKIKVAHEWQIEHAVREASMKMVFEHMGISVEELNT